MFALPAEGSSDPYYDEPSNEPLRLERVRGILGRQPDTTKFAFFIAKSNNDNFVAYKWTGRGVDPMWISTQNVPAERRDTLNLAEELLYGVDTRVAPSGEWLVNLRAEQVKDRVMNLTLDDEDRPMLLGVLNERQCVIEAAYVQMKRGLIPDVDYVRLYGRAVDDGTAQNEILKK